MLAAFSEWLGNTQLSAVLSDTTHLSTWLIIPLSQCLHILSVAVMMISVGVLNLNLLGIWRARQTFAQLATHLMPWIWGALIVLFLTGALQTIAEPNRELTNIGFGFKMAMLAIVALITLIYQITIRRDPRYWELSPQRRQTGHILATISLFLWVGIAAAGRLIAYLGDVKLEF
jgi:uncharacterized membrane protein (DUF485 family)